MTTTARKHRMQTRLDDQAEHITRLEQTIAQLADENTDLRQQRDDANQAATSSELRGMQTATELADTQHTLNRIDGQHAKALADKDRQITELQQRLGIAAKARAAADQTQPIDTDTGRMHIAATTRQRFEHGPVIRLGISPLADTVQLPITNPAHLPGVA